jgi:16S rRNA (guanine966-N2)-methyltransferase
VRIVGGLWADRPLVSPAGRVRPTAEGVREVVMQLLRAELPDARVLDLFAGSGALGLEALSRGAASCDFVENHPSALHSLKANVAALRVRDRTRIFKHDAIPFTERLQPGTYDITFADPPYGSRKLDRILTHWAEAPFSTVLLVEHAPDQTLPLRGSTRRIGDAAVTVYRAPPGA